MHQYTASRRNKTGLGVAIAAVVVVTLRRSRSFSWCRCSFLPACNRYGRRWQSILYRNRIQNGTAVELKTPSCTRASGRITYRWCCIRASRGDSRPFIVFYRSISLDIFKINKWHTTWNIYWGSLTSKKMNFFLFLFFVLSIQRRMHAERTNECRALYEWKKRINWNKIISYILIKNLIFRVFL